MAGRKRARVQRSSSSSSSSSPQQEEKSLAQPSLRSRGAAASVSASTYSPPSLAAASRAASALLSSSTTSSSASSSSSAAAAAAEAESEMKAVWKAEAKAEAETAPSSSSLLSSDFLSESSGYVKDAFVDAVDSDWICPVCAAVCRDAETSICCQRLACRRCVISWFVVNAGRSCPLCGISPCSRAGFLPAPYIDRRVRSLTIRCPQGCATRGLVIGLSKLGGLSVLAASIMSVLPGLHAAGAAVKKCTVRRTYQRLFKVPAWCRTIGLSSRRSARQDCTGARRGADRRR